MQKKPCRLTAPHNKGSGLPGEGIPEKDLPYIFDRYYKVSKEKNGIEGTGLGLAIVKKILDLHHIPISVKSKSGESTSFSFTVPLPV